MELIVVCLLGLVSLTSGVIVYRQNSPTSAQALEQQHEQTASIRHLVKI